jgi:[citrate (pro-3S)-lyase] ligase
MSFENTDYRYEQLDLENPFDVKLVKDFLAKQDFDYNPLEVDCTMILYNLNNKIIGTGSYKTRTLRYIAVSNEYRESTAFADIVTFLTNQLLEKHHHTFVFTKPDKAKLFEGLGYSEIARAEPLFSVLEFGYHSIKDYQKYLQTIKEKTLTQKIASIVVNCNPYTNGHKYLIEKASDENEIVYLFVVEENLSVFPFEIRWELISKGIKHLKNVKMVKAGHYIVSGGIFPSYFLKNETTTLISEKQAELDVSIFAKYVVPVLNIKKRYIGTENYCATTAAYNRAMHKLLPQSGVEVIEITRKTSDDKNNFISASKVREAIKNDELEKVLDFIPETTKDFLLSTEANEIIKKIKIGKGRH